MPSVGARPRELADLPYAAYLEPLRGPLLSGGDYDTVHLDGGVLENAAGDAARFRESAFTSVTFDGGALQRARFNDVWMHAVRAVGTNLVESSWRDAEIVSSAFAGVEMYGSHLRGVGFFGCKLDSVNLRAAVLDEVAFVDCLLRDVDLGEAALKGVTFPGSRVERIRLREARLQQVDLRGARLEILDGVTALRGATISGAQLWELAPLIAQASGIAVDYD